MSRTGRISSAWEVLFDRLSIADEIDKKGFFTITANEIKEYTKKFTGQKEEPRLMAKFDSLNTLPPVFMTSKETSPFSILPTRRGEYIITSFKAYCNLEFSDTLKHKMMDYHRQYQSLDFKDLSSESKSLSAAYLSGVLNDFVGEALEPTLSGRMRSNSFGFKIQKSSNLDIRVENTQIEIDGVYEGKNTVTIVEAKNTLPESFMIRQLYYPLKMLRTKNVSKAIKTIFFAYSNNSYHLFDIGFSDEDIYGSFRINRYQKYRLNTDVCREKKSAIIQLIKTAQPSNEPSIPFPQADSLERVINLAEILYQRKQALNAVYKNLEKESMEKTEITELYGFTDRQSEYYSNACQYLGLIKKTSSGAFIITKFGEYLFGLDLEQRDLAIVKTMLRYKVINTVMKVYVSDGHISDATINQQIQRHVTTIKSSHTIKRRCRTIRNWISWIINLMNDER